MVRIIEDEVAEDPDIFSQENAASLFRRALPAAWRPIPSLPCIHSGFHMYIFRFPGVRHGSNGFPSLLTHFTRLRASEGCFKSVLSFLLHFTSFYKHRMFQVGSLSAEDVISKRLPFCSYSYVVFSGEAKGSIVCPCLGVHPLCGLVTRPNNKIFL